MPRPLQGLGMRGCSPASVVFTVQTFQVGPVIHAHSESSGINRRRSPRSHGKVMWHLDPSGRVPMRPEKQHLPSPSVQLRSAVSVRHPKCSPLPKASIPLEELKGKILSLRPLLPDKVRTSSCICSGHREASLVALIHSLCVFG